NLISLIFNLLSSRVSQRHRVLPVMTFPFNSLLPKNKVVLSVPRYSDQYKFRPPASPIVTETLKGGGTRLRGVNRTATLRTIPMPMLEKKRSRRRPKRNAQAKVKTAKLLKRCQHILI
ncbi:hypothetical protein EDD18DRAFT_1216171, partial [Armillaria luteobubalina]